MATFTKNIFLFLALSALCAPAVLPLSASAHILETDGTIGGVLHIDPNDAPVADSPAHFFFQFKNSAGDFNLAQCDCTISIQYPENPATLFSLHLLNGTTTNLLGSSISPLIAPDTLSFFYTFPQRAVYIVTVNGTSTNTSFPSFVLSYDIRIDTQAPPSAAPSLWQQLLQEHLTHLIIVVVGIGIGIVITIMDKKKRKKVE